MPLAGSILAAAVGSCVGSLVVTAIDRRRRNEPWLSGRSHCDHCGVVLGFAETIPVASYVLRRGACRACAAPISPAHPLAELSGAAIGASALAMAPLSSAPLLLALGLTLLVLALTDLRTLRLPDAGVAIVAALGLAISAFRGPDHLLAGVIAAAVSALLLLGLRWFYARRTGRQGLGLGDVKLIAALALWLGAGTPAATALAAVAALIWLAIARPASGKAPLGAFLAAAGWIVGLVGMQPWIS